MPEIADTAPAAAPLTAGLENKAVAPSQDKRLEPARIAAAPVETLTVELIHHYDHEGQDFIPGDTVDLPKPLAEYLVRVFWAKIPE